MYFNLQLLFLIGVIAGEAENWDWKRSFLFSLTVCRRTHTYTDIDGPATRGEISPFCDGRSQSPINFMTDYDCETPVWNFLFDLQHVLFLGASYNETVDEFFTLWYSRNKNIFRLEL